jgi:hypothetical protein
MKMQRTPAEWITGQDEPSSMRIPQGEGVVAHEVREAGLAPSSPGLPEDAGIRHLSGLFGRKAQPILEFSPVVDPDIRRQSTAIRQA